MLTIVDADSSGELEERLLEADDRGVPDPPPPPGPQPPTFPAFLAPLVRIMIGLIFIGGYLVLFIWGLVLGAKGHNHANWPVKDEDLQTLLSTLGGLAATLFTVALNLPTDDHVGLRAARTAGLKRTSSWEGLDRAVLVFLGSTLVFLFPFMTIVGFWEALKYTDTAPGFIVKFAGAGMGILVTALTVWLTGLTRPRPRLRAASKARSA